MRALLALAHTATASQVHLRPLWTQWLAGEPLELNSRRVTPPRALAELLPELAARLRAIARVRSEHPSADGSTRMLVELADGATVESVRLARAALCISTQVGCAVGCRFCKTGEGGLLRQLAPEELLAQVALARERGSVKRVVLMGMGEPMHNLDHVLEALVWLGGPGRLAHKSIVFSTVGEPALFERLRAHSVRPALALSLHTTDAGLRAELLPRAPRIDPAELLAAACDYADAVTWPLQVQWTLLEGINDSEREVERLVALLRGRRAMLNLIPWNAVEGFDFRRPDPLRARDMVRALKAGGVFATIRRSGGQDVEGACGQLRARSLPARRREKSP
ncbi:MAG: RNA methyltransferase [Planctomycetes bacterium]|nr:RNA methyltransferase [Planctomycetota bacterium]